MSAGDRLGESWVANADLWTEAVRSGAIASRKLATDRAIVDAVTARLPGRVLDLGCGEGWLARALAKSGIAATGLDASAPLIEAAKAEGGAAFRVASYEALAADPHAAGGPYDVIAANFAFLHEDLAPLLRAMRNVLAPGGAMIVQTLHPAAAGPPYQDGWRTEDFCGFGEGAGWTPMPWYFRTLGSWLRVMRENGYEVVDMAEPVHPETGAPLSLLMVGEAR